SMNTLDFFPVATPEAFAELTHAKTQGPAAIKAFKLKNSDFQNFKAHMSKKMGVLTPYEGSAFNSINSFYLVNEEKEKTAVRWSFVPVKQQAIVLDPNQNFFYENMQHNLKRHEIVWDMVITIARDDDIIDNAAVQWQGEHTQITAAKLKVISLSSEQVGECDRINYDPLVLSPGFEPSSDPLLQARRIAYAVSFGRRISEK
ncbi:MAG: catalase, partial [Pseudomonadota bacterium]